MKTRVLAILLLSGLLLVGCVQGSGIMATEERPASDFSRISVGGLGEVTIGQSNTSGVVVTADENLMRYVKTEVRGDTLHLGLEGPPFFLVLTSRSVQYQVTAPRLEGISVSGSGSVTGDGLAAAEMNISVSGSGDVMLDALAAENLRVRIAGSGGVTLSGAVADQDVSVSGSGSYRAGDLASSTAEASVSGSGSATVWAANRLDASVSGSGSVNYYGSPVVNSSVSGSGGVRRLGGR